MLILKSQDSLTPHSRTIVALSLRVRPKGCRTKAQRSKKDTEKAAVYSRENGKRKEPFGSSNSDKSISACIRCKSKFGRNGRECGENTSRPWKRFSSLQVNTNYSSEKYGTSMQTHWPFMNVLWSSVIIRCSIMGPVGSGESAQLQSRI